jgi:hypothetical protein
MANDKPNIYPDLNLSQEERNTLLKVVDIPTRDDLAKQFDASRVEYLKELRRKRGEFRLAVSQKGACSVYGLGGRFPITMYYEQLVVFMKHIEEIKAFMEKLPRGKWKIAS